MDELWESERYVSVYDVRERIEGDKQNAISDTKLAMATSMKAAGYTIPQIVKLTGFSRKRVLNL